MHPAAGLLTFDVRKAQKTRGSVRVYDNAVFPATMHDGLCSMQFLWCDFASNEHASEHSRTGRKKAIERRSADAVYWSRKSASVCLLDMGSSSWSIQAEHTDASVVYEERQLLQARNANADR